MTGELFLNLFEDIIDTLIATSSENQIDMAGYIILKDRIHLQQDGLAEEEQ